MKVKRKFLAFIVFVLGIFSFILMFYGFYLMPKYQGELQLEHIKTKTTVYFDEYGVPHIYADNRKDAMTALGYVHAQDRLWQMELLRRIAPGRLSELFGTKALKSDKFFSGLGIEEASDRAIAELDTKSESYTLAIAYLDGINQFLEKGTPPIEYTLVGVKKEKFTLRDVYNIFGYMSFSFAMGQKTDPLLTGIRDKLGMGYLKDFGIDGSFNKTRITSFKQKSKEYSSISKSIAQIIGESPVPAFIGSNSWVIGTNKTKSGKVIFANDPHIGFSQPGTWYEAHIVTPDYEMYGFYLAGTPFPLLGHNRQYAYGLTMFENDDVDFFTEKNNPANSAQYQKAKGWANYTTVRKIIKVRDSSDVVLKVKSTQHGPIMNDLIDGLSKDNPISMSWIYTEQPLHILDAVYGLSHAANMQDFQKSVGLIAAPGLNVMYGDAKGNIGWFASGKLYKRPTAINSNFILDGANGEDDKREYLDYSENPTAVNPPWNYVYSANNQPEAINSYLYPGYYLPVDRAVRINQLLVPKNDWDKKSVSVMMADSKSVSAEGIVNTLILNTNIGGLSTTEKEAVISIHEWTGFNGGQEIGPTIYNKWIYYYLKNTFMDELGKEDFKALLGTHIVKQIIQHQLANEDSPWWDNCKTKNKLETRKDIVTKSLKEAVAALDEQFGNSVKTWKWHRVHTVEHHHPLGSIEALRPFFNVGPFEVSGSNEVINNLFFDYTDKGIYAVKGGPSTRRIVDFGDIENSWSVLPTGQSGNPLSQYYDNQTSLYNQGRFRKMKLNKKEIISTSKKLVFMPAKI